jgi:hypothetical protein
MNVGGFVCIVHLIVCDSQFFCVHHPYVYLSSVPSILCVCLLVNLALYDGELFQHSEAV